MKSFAPALALALLTMTAHQAKAVELLVRVNDTVYATSDAVSTIGASVNQLGNTRVNSYQRTGQQQALNYLSQAWNYEAGAMQAAYACRQLAEQMSKTNPGSSDYLDLLDDFDQTKVYVYQYSQAAVSLVNAARSISAGYGIPCNLTPAVQKVQAAAQSASRLNTFIIDDGDGGTTSPYGIDPAML